VKSSHFPVPLFGGGRAGGRYQNVTYQTFITKDITMGLKKSLEFFQTIKPEKDQMEDIVKGIISIGLIVIGVWMWNHF
jgi:hypothetical protein